MCDTVLDIIQFILEKKILKNWWFMYSSKMGIGKSIYKLIGQRQYPIDTFSFRNSEEVTFFFTFFKFSKNLKII